MSFIFGGNTGQSYDDIQNKRRVAEQLLQQNGGTPRNVGEGLSAIGRALAYRNITRKADAADAANREAFDQQWSGMFSGGLPSFGGGMPAGGATPYTSPNAAIGDDAMAALVKTGLESRGMAPHVADAFVMNFRDESGLDPSINETSPTVPGSRGGFGLAQWTGPRRVALEDFAKGQGKPASDMNVQLDFLMSELQGPEAAAGKGIMAAPDTASAATAIVNDFLRPAEAHRAARAAEYGGGGPSLDIGTLAEIAGNPYASPGQKAIVSALMQQQMDAMDPMRRLELQKAQLELEALRNPQAKPVNLSTFEGPDGTVYSFNPVTGEKVAMTGAETGSDNKTVAEREALAIAGGLQPGTPEYQQFMLTGNTVGRGANEFGLTPVYGRDKDGNLVVMQLGKDGTAVQTEIPEGVMPDLSIRTEEAARGAAVGKESGQSEVDLAGARVAADRTLGLIDSLADDPYLDSMVGPVEGLMPNVSGDARRVQAKMDQLKGSAFLEAYNMLRGGGQITEVEGQKAQDAMFRMQAAQTEKDYRAALADFRSAVEVGIAKIEARSKATTSPVAGGSYTFNPETGELE